MSGLVWLVRDRSVGGTKKGRMDSTAPARIGRSAIIKTGVALCAPKKRNTETDVPSKISEDPAVDASF